jgi:hypothetical protein
MFNLLKADLVVLVVRAELFHVAKVTACYKQLANVLMQGATLLNAIPGEINQLLVQYLKL